MTPADVADEALIVVIDALTTENQGRSRGRRVAELEPVEFVGFRIGHDRVLRLPVQGVVVVVVERPDELHLRKELEPPRFAGLGAESPAERDRVRVLGQPVLIDRFRSQAQIDHRRGRGDCVRGRRISLRGCCDRAAARRNEGRNCHALRHAHAAHGPTRRAALSIRRNAYVKIRSGVDHSRP